MPSWLQSPTLRLHFLAWGAALGLCLMLFFRLARAAALDLEALVYNQAEGLVARVDQAGLATDVLLLKLAALPLAAVVTARVVYAMVRWLRGTADPVGAMPLWARLGIFVAAQTSFHFFCEPCARALSVGLSVEAFGWIQWSDNVQPAMAWILEETPLLLRALVWSSGALALWLSLRETRPLATVCEPAETQGARAGWRRWAGRLARWGVAGVALLLLLCLAVAVGLHGSRVATTPGLGRFSRTCGGCHIRARPLFFIKTPSEWRTTVTRMRKLEQAPLSEGQAEDVIAFLGGMRSFDDGWTFYTRCLRCHGLGSLTWEPRPTADWERITRRLARFSPYYYKAPVRRQIVAHLKQAHGDEGATFGLPAKRYRALMALADACETCHSITRGVARARRLDQRGAVELLRRHNAKRAQPWSEGELSSIARTYRALVADAALMERLFPHHSPEGGGLPW